MSAVICETCGAKVVEYKHGLSKGLVRVLYLIAQAGLPGSTISMSEVKLTYSQRCNSQKLRYWYLIEKVHDELSKGGDWRITQRGSDFLQGKISLPQYVWTFHGEQVRYEGRYRYIDQVTGGWKWRPDYGREAIPH
jgi:hypothetical protein